MTWQEKLKGFIINCDQQVCKNLDEKIIHIKDLDLILEEAEKEKIEERARIYKAYQDAATAKEHGKVEMLAELRKTLKEANK